ncbi:MAG TPA: hypothetical protein H9737_02055, partial [Candidatus Borkfalkia faecigallinarum]|nr:hypothetical protein [Candidatus Borkfalkia faecigallinarum]
AAPSGAGRVSRAARNERRATTSAEGKTVLSPPLSAFRRRQLAEKCENNPYKIFEKSKITLLDFSPDLPQGLRGKSEFAAFIKGVP